MKIRQATPSDYAVTLEVTRAAEVERFDRRYPPMEKVSDTPSQLRLRQLVGGDADIG